MRSLSTLSLIALCACAPGQDRRSAAAQSCADPVSAETARVYQGLRPACEGCHSSGARGYFASAATFQQLLAADPRLVAPGKPEDSELVRLLEGQGTGAFRQMPIAGEPYARSSPPLPVEDVKAWIRGLSAQRRGASPAPDAPRVARMSAQQIQRALYQQLGLGYGDFFTTVQEYGVPVADASLAADDRYPMHGPDMIPMPRNDPPAERFLGLGGGSALRQARADASTPPTFVHLITQLSQRWCRLALAKAGNRALFPGGAVLSTDAAAVKETILRWHLHFLGEPGTAAQAEALYGKVFAPLQQASGAEPAYVALCTYFIRHPQWLFY